MEMKVIGIGKSRDCEIGMSDHGRDAEVMNNEDRW